MSIELLTILLLITMMILFAAGIPIALGLGGLAMLVGYFVWGPECFKLIHSSTMSGITGYLLSAVPLFIFMGQILRNSGLSEAMFQSIYVLSGRLPGGLAVGVIIICSMLAAMTGVMSAGIMTAGLVAIPPMLKRGYNKHLTLGAVMAGGGLGILIPPSVVMIFFCMVTKTSIGKMFAAGLIPGLIMSLSFIVYIIIRCLINPKLAPPLPKEEFRGIGNKIIAVRDSGISFGLIFLVLGSILFGVATPTESAAIGGVGAIIIAIIYRKFGWRVLREASINTAGMTGMLVWIVIGVSVFNDFYMFMGAADMFKRFFIGGFKNPWTVIIMMQISLFILGFVMDEIVLILMVAGPLYTPIAVSLGFDPIWFGILIILNTELAIQTPPYGFALFFMKAAAPPDITMLDIYKSVTPFLLIKIGNLALCMAFPEIVLWLPNLLFTSP
ncbi:MAG: TRAP transporter large permease subunit [Deltaproteobacteria bacterium]|nr:TRAP transporter large permease subunit [Deltaproteobacteria bacterium]